ncbi:hypothetical protein C8A03DRAFT_45689 [Achaetomium macrosporum]|uniref:DUF7580 domain-containing protein n=1 Tax=Achaetomium macrosporum TaxID=79813 RepID=A0AAN7H9D0_9PEZI|nr:hypothetical protein C8A03DRAFT_45689 [Achaetomium macrosporum]
MSGFDVAGAVLGTLPMNLMKDWGKAASELKSIHQQLTTERAKLYNVCDQLLSDLVPQKDIEPMLGNPFTGIRRRLWQLYDCFEKTVLEIQKALETVKQRLSIDVANDGQVKWVERGWMPREFRKFLYRLDRKDYQEALSTISKGVNDLEVLIRLSVALEPNRRKRAGGRLINMLRDLSCSVYRALRSSIRCNDPHDINLGLWPQFPNVGYEDEDEEILGNTHLRVAISFETTNGQISEKRKCWDEVNIKRMPTSVITKATTLPAPAPQGPGILTAGRKRAKIVAFAKASTFSTGKPKSNIKCVLAEVTQQVTNITFAQTPDDANMPPLELCPTLRKALGAPLDSYGRLIDPQQPTRHFKVYPLATARTTNSDTLSIATLDDILGRKPGLQPLLWLEDQSPWLREPLTKKHIYFFVKDGQPAYQQPFLWTKMPEFTQADSGVGNGPTGHRYNNTLFCLGILLLEIILRSKINSLRHPHDNIGFQGDGFEMIRDSITAHRLLPRVASINPAYKAAVERCLGCGACQDLDEAGFCERVYNGVVAELEALLESTNLVS